MLNIGNDEGSISWIVLVLASEPDALPAGTVGCQVCSVIDSNVSLAVGNRRVSLLLGRVAVDVLDEAVLRSVLVLEDERHVEMTAYGGVGGSEEIKAVEEVVATDVFGAFVDGERWREK